MSQQYMNQDVPMPNGLPPNWCGTTPSMVPPPQKNFNGVGSSHSSRDSSPGARNPANINVRGNIPASQLPPQTGGRPAISPIPYNLGVNSSNGHTSASVPPQLSDNTPHSSPKIQNFSTSTPNSPPRPPQMVANLNSDTVNKSNTANLVNPQNVPNMRTNLLTGEQQQQQQQQVRQDLNQPNTLSNQSYNFNTAPLQRPPLNQFQQPSSQVQPPPNPANLMQPPPNPINQMPQPPNPMQQTTNHGPQPLKSMQQPPNLMPQPPKPMQPPTNIMQQTPNPQSTNQGPQLPKPMQPPTNVMHPQSTNQGPQPVKQMQPPLNPMQQPPNPMQPMPPMPQLPNPNQMRQQPSNQLRQSPKPTQQYPNQFPAQTQTQNQAPIPNMRSPHTYASNMPGAASYPTSPISNLHSKRYPPPVSQPQTQNTALMNNYNQQQTMYNQNQPAQIYQQMSQQQQQQQYQQLNPTQQRNIQQLNQQMQNMNVAKSGFNKMWGHENYDLLQCPNVLPEEAVQPPKVSLGQEFLDAANCSHEIFRCTMTKIPESNSLLQKSRLPLGVLIHPFKDLNHLPVIQCNTIVRCRACRTYINPFIFFVDTKRWKCNLCYRVNELPEEFQYDPVSKSYGDPSRRPEIKSSTIEYIAPSEYMLRPPQPAVYLFLLDISRLAIESGYLHTICDALSSQLATLPGDARTQIGFIAYNTTLHFFSLAEGLNQPHEMIVTDVDDVFLPCPDNLLVNLKEHMDLVTDLLAQLPTRYQNSFDGGSALGAALQAAYKMMSSTGGRVTVFQVSLPMVGPGALTVREDPNQRAGKEAPHLNPATDFYKRLALDCSGNQIAVDLFILNSQYVDIATLSGISRFSGGCMHHFPLFKASKTLQADSLDRCFKRYLNRKIGFEAVMRVRCTRGLSIHTFHGNLFVRSTDLLSLPNINPDAGFGMQVSIEESLSDLQSVCFQAALLYTSSKGERRIRVHTLCLPVVNSLSDVLNSADQQCIVGILSKMAVDRSLQSSLSDARDAFINVAIDILSSYKLSLNMGNSASGLLAPQTLKLLPLYILALLKYTAFRTGQSTRLDDRVFAMCDMKTLPLQQLIQNVYPDLYPIYRLAECPSITDAEGVVVPQPRRLQLTARNIDSHGAYILDAGQQMFIYVCPNVSQQFLIHSLGVPNYTAIPDPCYELPSIDNPDNQRLHAFINSLNDEKPYPAALQIIRDNSTSRSLLLERLIEDRIESALSYNEFLQHLKTQVK